MQKLGKLIQKPKVLNQVEFKGKEELKSYEIELKNLENALNDLKFLIEKISRLESFKNQIKSIQEKIMHLDTDLQSITKDSIELDEIDGYINYFETLLDNLKEYNRNQKELENIKYQYKRNINKIEANEESINVLTQQIDSFKEELKKSEIKLEELIIVPNEIIEAKSNYEKTEIEFQLIKEKIVETKTLIEKLKEDISKVRDDIAKKESLRKQLNKFNDYHIWINDYLIPTLSLIEKHVMQIRYEEFNDDFQKWFNILIEDTFKNC